MEVLERAADIVVLKPMFAGTAKICTGSFGPEARVRVMVTTALDSAIGRASALHLAAALANDLSIAAGLDTGGWLLEDSASMPRAVGGFIDLAPRAGLGLERVRVFS